MISHTFRSGYSIVEVLLSGGLFAVGISGIVISILFAQRVNQANSLKLTANRRATEGMTIIRTIRDRDFADVINGSNMALSLSSGEWNIISNPSATDDLAENTLRRVSISNGTTSSQKQVTITVSYAINSGKSNQSFTLTEIISDRTSVRGEGVTSQSQNYKLSEDLIGTYDDVWQR